MTQLEGLKLQNRNLKQEKTNLVGLVAKVEDRLKDKNAWCDMCKRLPTICFLNCQHAFCNECVNEATDNTKITGCPSCIDDEIMIFESSPGMTLTHDGTSWIAGTENFKDHEGHTQPTEVQEIGHGGDVAEVDGGDVTDVEDVTGDEDEQ